MVKFLLFLVSKSCRVMGCPSMLKLLAPISLGL